MSTLQRFSQLASRIQQLPSSARELEGSITDLINRLQTKYSVRTQSHREVVQEITQPSKDQDVKTKDDVGRIHGVLDSLALRLCDDAEFTTKVLDARHNQTHSHMTTITESLDSKLRDDRDDQMISQGDAPLRRMHRLSLLGQTKIKLDYVLGTHCSKDHRETLADRSIQVEAWRSPLTKSAF